MSGFPISPYVQYTALFLCEILHALYRIIWTFVINSETGNSGSFSYLIKHNNHLCEFCPTSHCISTRVSTGFYLLLLAKKHHFLNGVGYIFTDFYSFINTLWHGFLWFPRKQTEECRVKPAQPSMSCPPPHPGRAIIVWKPHKQKSRGDGGYNAHECVYKCVCVHPKLSLHWNGF